MIARFGASRPSSKTETAASNIDAAALVHLSNFNASQIAFTFAASTAASGANQHTVRTSMIASSQAAQRMAVGLMLIDIEKP